MKKLIREEVSFDKNLIVDPEVEDFAYELESIFLDYFPESYIDVSFSRSLSYYILDIRYALGAGKHEFVNGLINNDPMSDILIIYLGKDGKLTDDMELRSLQRGGLFVKPFSEKAMKYYHGEDIKIFRKIIGDPRKILKGFDAYMAKLWNLVKENIDNLHNDLPFDPADKL